MNESVSERRIEELVALARAMTAPQLDRLIAFAKGQSAVVHTWVNPDSDLVTPAFREELDFRLTTHHALQSKPLGRVPFEDAFRAGCVASGLEVGPVMSATEKYIDLVVDDQRIALKTTSAKNVDPRYAHISKLCEAAWIQDVRGPAQRQERTFDLFRLYLGTVDRLFQLRVIPDSESWSYELLEIPMDLFRGILLLHRDAFTADGPSVRVEDSRGYALTLRLDRSDAKITIGRIPVARCLVHATWMIPK